MVKLNYEGIGGKYETSNSRKTKWKKGLFFKLMR